MARALFALARGIVVGTLFVSLWTWFVPSWLASRKGVALALEPGAASIPFMVLGAILTLWCVWEFAWTGLGTPAPFDPPRRLVVRGPYRWVRNPMYVGVGTFLIGEALALRSITREMLILVATLWVASSLFILVYEEPALRGLFGKDYENYCKHVRRWVPRLTPFDIEKDAP